MSSTSEDPFVSALKSEMATSRYNDLRGNHDANQMSVEASVWVPMLHRTVSECVAAIRQCFSDLASSLGRLLSFHLDPKRHFEPAAAAFGDAAFLHNLVVDERSKDLVVKLCAFRAMGHRKIRLPRNTEAYWRIPSVVSDLKTDAEPIKIEFMNAALAKYDCAPIGFDLQVYGSNTGVGCTFVQRQYEFREDVYHYSCKVEAGDVVIDAGACWGDTTLYFAHEAGPSGRVIAFEFIPSNIHVLRSNLNANPELAKRVTVMDRPLWEDTGRRLYYVDWGPGSRVSDDPSRQRVDGSVETISIDDAVEQTGLLRVDFIKMDIEGAELSALRGAERTIRAHRPKLAISIYHQLSDYWSIPRFLYGLNLTYDFFLDHHTLYENETVLFAIPRGRVRSEP